jgi:hypothetical protein
VEDQAQPVDEPALDVGDPISAVVMMHSGLHVTFKCSVDANVTFGSIWG